ncbi:MAG: SPFH domain-containing protein, partial [Christensenellaceae bacterium]|nr:SPFH domain-containing protein [Christensenellaceae bacterium]
MRTEKMSSRTCPHCGNQVIFDQSHGATAKCPVCHEAINTMAQQDKMVEFGCSQCGVRLRTVKGASIYTCPICDFENDVAERVKSEEIRMDGLASIIKYEGDAGTLVWKHPIEDFNLGSQLIVHESQDAIFFRDGQALDTFGAGRYTLETQQLPLLEKLYKLPTDTEGTFHSEVYYINIVTQMGIKWGTDSKVRLFDPTSGLHVELGASGEFNVRVVNSRKLLLKIVGTTGTLTQEQLMGSGGKGFFRAMVMTQVKSFLASA